MSKKANLDKHRPAPPNLPTHFTEDFYLEDEVTFEGIKIEDLDYSYLNARNLMIKGSHLKKITMQRTRLERVECSNVVFEKCDLSNLDWIGGSFHQVVFDQCKLTGTNFAESYLRDCRFTNCIANFASFSATNVKNVQFDNCQLNDSEFFEATWKHLFLENNELTNSNWMNTTMAGLDLTTNEFEGIVLSQDRLRGLIVNQEQALTIAAGLGIKIV
ncbi:pentapeptide repeat-containing protein [Enterococcus sp. AZ109]|uniref:pentapeptide repeat-containing protein n=1 Tax=Enterococcus sp. AZ109 TaxID=2774634 RepID=UPI003F686E72